MKSAQNSFYRLILTNFPTLGALYGPLQDQGSKYKSSECTNNFHKLILSENAFISNFGGMKMNEMYPKVIILVNFDQFLHH